MRSEGFYVNKKSTDSWDRTSNDTRRRNIKIARARVCLCMCVCVCITGVFNGVMNEQFNLTIKRGIPSVNIAQR